MYILKTEWYLDLYIGYIFLHERILQTFLKNVCIYPSLKYETLKIAPASFLHNLCVLNLNLSDTVVYFVSFTSKKAEEKMAAKTTSFLHLCYKLLLDFRFLHH